MESGVVEEALKVLQTEQPKLIELSLIGEERGGIGMECGGSVQVYLEPVLPPFQLLVVGGGHVGLEVAKLANRVGFSVTVIDPALGPEEVPGVRLIRKPVEEVAKEVRVDKNTFVVIAFRHKGDEEALRAFAGSPARYVGWLASRARIRATYEKLIADGIPREQLDRVHAPIGLDIGAKSPPEIATGILAEMIKIKRNPGATGRSLKDL